jgi:peptidoglycan/xylan/chitin deacetylase (PgdA/CDA1 family)
VLAGSFTILLVLTLAHARDALLVTAVAGVTVAAAFAFAVRAPQREGRVRALAFGSTLVLVTLAMTAYFGASTVSAQWFGGGVTHGPRNSGRVAITFDDAPDSPTTPQLMRVLDAAHVHATFFVVGQSLMRAPGAAVVRELMRHGHQVANHSFHHDEWRWLDPRYPELERAQLAFKREIGTCPAWFRPPNGDHTPFMARVVHKHGMRMAMWDVSPRESDETPQQIAQRVLHNARSGSIIDLRDGIDGTSDREATALVHALPMILDGLRAMHLQPVRLDQLVGGPAYTSCGGHSS